MKVKILFDKESLDKNLHTGWGVSFLINDKVLFDTGEKGEWLIHNMKLLDVEIDKIEAVVISHDHWDHKDGLWALLKERPGLKVYACSHFSKVFKEKVKSFKGKLVEIDKFSNIIKNIYTTGQILDRHAFRSIAEQAVAIKSAKGIIILTGCAHPGIIKIIQKVKQNLPGKIHLVLGGFHLMNAPDEVVKDIVANLKRLRIEKAGPTHCTGERATQLFKEEYGKDFLSIKVGQIIDLS